jgi:MFS family permease
MIGFGLGGILMGRLADRFGVTVPLLIGAAGLGLGFAPPGLGGDLWLFALAHGVLIGLLGSGHLRAADRRHLAVVRAPARHRGGDLRQRQLPRRRDLAADRAALRRNGRLARHLHRHRRLLRDRDAVAGAAAAPAAAARRWRRRASHAGAHRMPRRAGRSACRRATLQTVLLCIAGVACCVAMSMPQVHIVAYCGDLGYGAARGAEMLSLMLGFGIVSRLASGFDLRPHRRPAHAAARLGLQGVALLLFLPFDGLVSLYVISALFGLFQGGIVPSYAIIVREHFSRARPARVGTC